MPIISRFYGIVVKMYYDDHNPPHFHAQDGGHEGVIYLGTWKMAGHLPRRARKLVLEWAKRNEAGLREDWSRAEAGMEPLFFPESRCDLLRCHQLKRAHGILRAMDDSAL